MSAWHVEARGAVALHANRAARAAGHSAARRRQSGRRKRGTGCSDDGDLAPAAAMVVGDWGEVLELSRA
jgi:hypothetical protein